MPEVVGTPRKCPGYDPGGRTFPCANEPRSTGTTTWCEECYQRFKVRSLTPAPYPARLTLCCVPECDRIANRRWKGIWYYCPDHGPTAKDRFLDGIAMVWVAAGVVGVLLMIIAAIVAQAE